MTSQWAAVGADAKAAPPAKGLDRAEERARDLATEQAALRQVATLVARESSPDQLFAVVAEQVARILEVPQVRLVRYEQDGSVVVGAFSDGEDEPFPIGSRWLPDDPGVTTTVRRTGRPARVEDYVQVTGEIGAAVRGAGMHSAVASPIVVETHLWGAIVVLSPRREVLPEDAEARLTDFTELVATAIANAEARQALARLADEQTALRRVATQVASGTGADELFAAVADEVQQLLGADASGIVRFEDDGTAVTVGTHGGPYAAGTHTELEPHFVVASVRGTRRAARFDTDDPATADMPAIVRDWGIRSAVASPIVVEGELWGTIVVASRGSLPQESEARLGDFTDLVATAVANTQARQEVTALADEQAALRRVATLVAQEASHTQVVSTIAREIGELLGLELLRVVRYQDDGTAVVVAGSGMTEDLVPVGSRTRPDVDSAASRVFRTRKPVRIDDYETASDTMTQAARSAGVRGVVATPIWVEGRLWGAMTAGTTHDQPLPPETEARLGQFTELVATAIANAESREARAVLAEEQAALRRVATLVAEAVPASELFGAVALEVSTLFGAAFAGLARFEGDSVLVVGESVAGTFPPEARLDNGKPSASAEVLRTGRSARVDAVDWSQVSRPLGAVSRHLGIASTVASPIVVEGTTWGALSISSTDETLPQDTEERLEKFSDLVATAIANAEGRSELAASRRRIVAASDDARRRIERDLHDGVQQQLVSLGLELGAMKADPPTGDALKEQLASVKEDVGSVFDALVEIARGIHPAILSQGGLAAALRALARRSAVPVTLHAQIEGPLPDEVEVAAYYVAAEALTNAAKHARAAVVHMDVTTEDGVLTLMVRDDGIGGADPGGGSGLVGLQDRVEALGGTIKMDSSAGRGTSVVVTLPIATEPD
jgi:signal transduction histidine kinase